MSATGYANRTSIAPGGKLQLSLSGNPAGTYALRFQQIGIGIVDEFSRSLPKQLEPANGWEGFHWTSFDYKVPQTWSTGLYRLEARGPGATEYAQVLDVVVTPERPGAIPILLLVDFLVMQVYNEAGGKSLYDFNSGGMKADRVSFDRWVRPLDGEVRLIHWLQSKSIPFECASIMDLHASDTLLKPYACAVIAGHSEYWSKEMRDHMERFIERGGNLVSLSGNTCFRQVRLENNDRTIVCYKYAKNDPIADLREKTADLSRTTVAWSQPPVNRPQNTMLGVGWSHGAWNGPGTPYKVHFPTHWVFAGAPLGTPDPQTSAFMTYETDAAPFALEPEPDNYPRVTGEEATPLSTVVLASADLGHWTGKPGMATMTLMVRGGTVFSAGTTDWMDALGNEDQVIDRVTLNVLTRLQSPRTFDWENIGHANNVTAMCAADNKLYVTTDDNRLWRRYPVLANANWTPIGRANDIVSMAGTRGMLFALTSGNALVYRSLVEKDIDWKEIDEGPELTEQARALGACGGALYAIAQNGELYARPAREEGSWRKVPLFPSNDSINSLTSYNGILFASTVDNRLLRTNTEFIEEAQEWLDIHHCDNARGLAVVDNMLFTATSSFVLWWLDLRSPALAALSGRTAGVPLSPALGRLDVELT
jgi:hypothetical protein